MNETRTKTKRFDGLSSIVASLILGMSLLIILFQTIQAQENVQIVTDIDASQKTVDADEGQPGSVLSYSVSINNSAGEALSDVSMKDVLPAGLSLLTDTIEISPEGIGDYDIDGGVITWTGTISGNSQLMISYRAQLTDTLEIGNMITNIAVITAPGMVISRSAVTTIVSEEVEQFFPVIFTSPPIPVLTLVSRPNSQNEWTVGWTVEDADLITGYELQEAKQSDFVGATTIDLPAGTTSIERSHGPSIDRDYYYRVRAKVETLVGPWSDTLLVLGPYRDNFDSSSSGWELRRTTFLDKTAVWYSDGELVIIVDDRWDWMIASPMLRAPEPPYYIQYRARVNDPSNLVTGGLVVGGDWNGEPCPDYTTVNTLYTGKNCFNQFYNFNYIFYGPIKLLFERVDELVWCPKCGGSPMKRLGDIGDTWSPFKVLNNGPAKDWHTYRVEVRSDGLKLFIDGDLEKTFSDNRYVNQPYFGVFASADEYKPSIWLFDYFEVGYIN